MRRREEGNKYRVWSWELGFGVWKGRLGRLTKKLRILSAELQRRYTTLLGLREKVKTNTLREPTKEFVVGG